MKNEKFISRTVIVTTYLCMAVGLETREVYDFDDFKLGTGFSETELCAHSSNESRAVVKVYDIKEMPVKCTMSISQFYRDSKHTDVGESEDCPEPYWTDNRPV